MSLESFEVVIDRIACCPLLLFYDLDDGEKTSRPTFGAALKNALGRGVVV